MRSFGTEGRTQNFVPPSNDVYDYITFRGTDIKNLFVSETTAPTFQDPAIVSRGAKRSTAAPAPAPAAAPAAAAPSQAGARSSHRHRGGRGGQNDWDRKNWRGEDRSSGAVALVWRWRCAACGVRCAVRRG